MTCNIKPLIINLSQGCILSVVYSVRSSAEINISKMFKMLNLVYDCRLKNHNEINVQINDYGMMRICASGLVQFFISKNVLDFIIHKDALSDSILYFINIKVDASSKKGQIIYQRKNTPDKLIFLNRIMQTFLNSKIYMRESNDFESIFVPVQSDNLKLRNGLIYRIKNDQFILTISVSGCLNVMCYKFRTLASITNLLN